MNITATTMNPELLDRTRHIFILASDTNSLIVRNSDSFRRSARELAGQLETTAEFTIGYQNHYHRANLETNFYTANIIELWLTLNRIANGDNSLGMKIKATELTATIGGSEIWQDYKDEQWLENAI
jgi:hypothetical protein